MNSFDEWYKQFKARLEAVGSIGIDESMCDAYLAGLRAAAGMACIGCGKGAKLTASGLHHDKDFSFPYKCGSLAIHREIAKIQGEQ